MKFSLAAKLTLSFLFIALTATIIAAVVMRLYSAQQFNQLVIEQQRGLFSEFLLDYYGANGSWAGLPEQLNAEDRTDLDRNDYKNPDRKSGIAPGRHFAQHPNRRWEFFGLADASGVVVIPFAPNSPPGSIVPARMLAGGEPLEMDGGNIGTVLTVLNPPDFSPAVSAVRRPRSG